MYRYAAQDSNSKNLRQLTLVPRPDNNTCLAPNLLQKLLGALLVLVGHVTCMPEMRTLSK